MRITTVVVVLALLGCEPPSAGYRVQGPARYTKLNEPPRPMLARSPWSVTIYQVRLPTDPFIEVSQIADLGENENLALDRLRLSSGRLGCDGLIVGGSRVESIIAGTVQQVSLSGTCIKFIRDPGTWRAPEPEPELEPKPEPKDEPKSESKPHESEVCVRARARIFATKDPRERARIAGSIPPECHPK